MALQHYYQSTVSILDNHSVRYKLELENNSSYQ